MYPKYFSITQPSSYDLQHPIKGLLCQEAEDKFIVIFPSLETVSKPQINIRQCSSLDAVKNLVGGNIEEAVPEFYNDVLFNLWGFDGSLKYTALTPEEIAFDVPPVDGAPTPNEQDQRQPADLEPEKAEGDTQTSDGSVDITTGVEYGLQPIPENEQSVPDPLPHSEDNGEQSEPVNESGDETRAA